MYYLKLSTYTRHWSYKAVTGNKQVGHVNN